MTTSVPVMLDLREYGEPPADPQGYLTLWSRIEPVLLRCDARDERQLSLRDGERGVIGVRFLTPERNPGQLPEGTRFAIHGVLEKPTLIYRCDTCRQQGEERYGPFRCRPCADQGRQGRVCDHHVRILDGSFQARCPEHLPACDCGRPSVFWCEGRRCARRKAWCDAHRLRHPGHPATSYCQNCYDTQFPACAMPGCRQLGHLRCGFVLESSRRECGRRVCAPHAERWQIYGYGPRRQRGPALCQEHARELRSIPRLSLVFQLVAGTAARLRHNRSSRLAVPRLTAVRHIFINVRNEALDPALLNTLFEQLRESLARGAQDAELVRLLDAGAEQRRKDLHSWVSHQDAGRAHFARLVDLLRQDGKEQLAARVSFSSFQAGSNHLFVRVPDDLVGLFLGKQGSSVKHLSERLGITVNREKR